jgi:CheY-like chemotaxis protein
MREHTTNAERRILVVDDDPASREIACMWLDELGCPCQSAVSAADALARLSERRYDLLMVDVHLQGELDGFELIIAALHRQPHIKAMFVSASPWTTHQALDPGTTFLHKPYTKAELQRALAVLLAG